MEKMIALKPIKYKNRVVDEGLILGQRKYHWMLKKKYSPVFACIGQNFVSECSPQKQNFFVYVSRCHLEAGKQIFIYTHDYKKPVIKTNLEILEVGTGYIKVKVIKEDIVEKTFFIPQQTQTTEEIVF